MKHGSYILLVILFLSFFSCDEIEKLLTFYVEDETTFTVASAAPLNLPFEIATPDVATNSSQQFENNNTRADLVKEIKLTQLDLSITSPSGKTFSFLKSIHIYISTDNADEIELAYADNIPANASEIQLTPTKNRLDAYVKASSYKLRTEVVTRETVTEDVDIKTNLKFRVTADPL
jgi:hypothetical protein